MTALTDFEHGRLPNEGSAYSPQRAHVADSSSQVR